MSTEAHKGAQAGDPIGHALVSEVGQEWTAGWERYVGTPVYARVLACGVPLRVQRACRRVCLRGRCVAFPGEM